MATPPKVPDDGLYHPGQYGTAVQSISELHKDIPLEVVPTPKVTATIIVPQPATWTTIQAPPPTQLPIQLPIQSPVQLSVHTETQPQLLTQVTAEKPLTQVTAEKPLPTIDVVDSVSAFTTESTSTSIAVPSQQATPSAMLPTDMTSPKQLHQSTTSYIPLLTVMLVILLMAIAIIFWLRRKNEKRKQLLRAELNHLKSGHTPFDSKDSSKLEITIKEASSGTHDTISVSAKSVMTGTIASRSCDDPEKAGILASTTDRAKWKAADSTRKLMNFMSETRNNAVVVIISHLLKWHKKADTIHSPGSCYSEEWSASTHSSFRDPSLEEPSGIMSSQSLIRVHPEIQPPPAVARQPQIVPLEDTVPQEEISVKPPSIISPCPTASGSRTPSRASSVSKISERSAATSSRPLPAGPSVTGVGLFRKNVHRVEMDFKSLNDTQLQLHVGDLALITQIFDDGWVSQPLEISYS